MIDNFGETEDVKIITLIDNYTNLILESKGEVKRLEEDFDPPLAEHGLSIYIQLKSESQTVLLDTGVTKVSLLYNMKAFKLDPRDIDKLVISHGHFDHTASVVEVIRASGKRMPVVVHPHVFLERWFISSDGRKAGPQIVEREEWEEVGAEIVEIEKPYQLTSGCWATGPVPRTNDFELGIPTAYYRDNGEFKHDPITDDQSIVVNIKGKGLVIISGCAHAGIINTVNYAREISGVEKVHTVIGGFHLTGASEEKIERTIKEMKAFKPKLVIPMHCTGFSATREFAEEMPSQFVLNAVGTSIHF